ncbi:hypothetical protein PR001_g33242, partial [Phytophthora rubi]
MLKHFDGNVYRADDDGAKFGNCIYQHNKSVDLAREVKDVRFRDDKPASVG